MMEWKGQGARMPPAIFAKVGEEETVETEASEGMGESLLATELDVVSER